jgi:hypothetical protein
MLGILFIGEGNEGSRVLDNYNLLFACLIHNMMTPMMITILTCEWQRALCLSGRKILPKAAQMYFFQWLWSRVVFWEGKIYLAEILSSTHASAVTTINNAKK